MAHSNSDSEQSDPLVSPEKVDIDTSTKEPPQTPTDHTRFDTDEVREAALCRERDGVRNINEVIEGVLGTLERAKGKMSTVSNTVNNASTLLNTWTRILSQTEHNQRIILNPNWKGATQDLIDIESEAIRKQKEAERRAAEAERRREAARGKPEKDEQQKMATQTTRGGTGRGTRAGGTRTRGTSRVIASSVATGRGTGSVSSRCGYANDSSTTLSSVGTSRGGSGIGRGLGGSRAGGRARGTR